MNELIGKRLLVLGGGLAAYDVVKTAKENGAYVVSADYYETGVAKSISDKSFTISTTDYPSLLKIIKSEKIDGVFCGPGEFNLRNVMELCKQANLPFYATEEQWEICSDKSRFKAMCRKHDVPCVPEYHITEEFLPEDMAKIKYPVIVKPVDSSSARGIAVCSCREELIAAYKNALTFSNKKHVIVEKYISNDPTFGVKYVVYNGEIYSLLINDRYVVDPVKKRALISCVLIYPSRFNEKYMQTIDEKVKRMFKALGLKNCTLFMQALVDPEDGNFYFHEMGLRVGGGLTYTITEKTMGVSDLLMMLRYSLGMDFSSPKEIEAIDPNLGGKVAVSLCVPLRAGVIKSFEGVKQCCQELELIDYTQYHQPGDIITDENIGTLDQHFCRIKFLVNSYDEVSEKIDFILKTIKITADDGADMIFSRFDTSRLYKL
jgi:biotin carboxylase